MLHWLVYKTVINASIQLINTFIILYETTDKLTEANYRAF